MKLRWNKKKTKVVGSAAFLLVHQAMVSVGTNERDRYQLKSFITHFLKHNYIISHLF